MTGFFAGQADILAALATTTWSVATVATWRAFALGGRPRTAWLLGGTSALLALSAAVRTLLHALGADTEPLAPLLPLGLAGALAALTPLGEPRRRSPLLVTACIAAALLLAGGIVLPPLRPLWLLAGLLPALATHWAALEAGLARRWQVAGAVVVSCTGLHAFAATTLRYDLAANIAVAGGAVELLAFGSGLGITALAAVFMRRLHCELPSREMPWPLPGESLRAHGLIGAALVLGVAATVGLQRLEHADHAHQLAERARSAAALLDPEFVASLRARADDLERADVRQVVSRLRALRTASRSRFLYLAECDRGGYRFLLDAEPAESQDYSPPGQFYGEAPPEFFEQACSGLPQVLGPIQDHYGAWVTAIHPLPGAPGRPLRLVGVDVDAAPWRRALGLNRLFGIGALLAVLGIGCAFLAAFVVLRRTDARVQREAREREAHERLAADVMRRFLAASPETFEDAVGQSLREAGEATDVDRIVLLAHDRARHALTCTHEWCRAGVPSIAERVGEIPIASRPWLNRHLVENREVDIPDVRRMPPEAAAESALLASFGIGAALIMPLEAGDEVLGTISFHALRPRRWSRREVATLRLITKTITTAQLRDRSERALRRASFDAEAANRAKSAFLASMSHEIRTPLNGVLGMTELVLGSRLDNDQRESLEIVARCGKALLALLDDLLDLAKIESGRMSLDVRSFELAPVVHEVVELFRPAAQKKGIALEGTFADDLPRRVVGDPLRLRQILANLVGNAVKFTAAGRIGIDVSRCRREPDSHLAFRIHDSGVGIPVDRLGPIFEAFTQADSTVAQRFGGTGLGLTISTQLARLMDGGLAVESTPGVGSVFTLRARLEPASDLETAPTGPVGAALDDDSGPQALRILVAEDNPVNQRVARRMLERLGHSVEIAENGRVALEMFCAQRFDLVLMDLLMPELDGLGATEAIRALEAEGRPRTPIVALSASVMRSDVDACLAKGMDGFLAKPVQSAALKAEIARLAGVRARAAD